MANTSRYSEVVHGTRTKLIVLGLIMTVTVAIHYGWFTERLFGHIHWLHALHSRFCYIPIAIAATWFGLRGGLLAATVISLLIVPFVLGAASDASDFTQELVEIFFYYAIGALVGILIDREMRVRQEHQEVRLQLERSHHLSQVGQMAAGVAHEVKNPLASIKGAIEIIRDESVPKADRDEFSDIAFREVKRIDGTVSEFLEFARPKETEKRRLNLSASVESSIKQLVPQVTKAGLRLDSKIHPDIHIAADYEKIHQVLLNLVLNSIEASQPRGSISIELSRLSSNRAFLSISDTGCGMSPAERSQAFDPFFTTKSTGTGLGLAIVKSIVDGHGGQIEIVSEPGKGTRVDITLPSIEQGDGL